MYNQSYDDYIRSVLGYSLDRNSFAPNIWNTYEYNNIYDNVYQNNHKKNMMQEDELENYFPEIYRIVIPMIEKTCNENVRPLTEQTINDMVDSIYNSVESNEFTENRTNSTTDIKKNNTSNKIEESRSNNFLLRDLIKILLLRELIRRRRRPGDSFPRPPRPPFPGGPGRPPMMMNRDTTYFNF